MSSTYVPPDQLPKGEQYIIGREYSLKCVSANYYILSAEGQHLIIKSIIMQNEMNWPMWSLLAITTACILAGVLIVYFITGIKKRVLMRDDKPYLIRWTIFKCKWGSLKIHKALVSDPADPHDHPWNYLSLILWGGYWEQQTEVVHREMSYNATIAWNEVRTDHKWYRPGRLLFRRGDRLHRLIIPKGKPCITLIFTFKKWRDWGFLKRGKWYSHKEGVNY